MATTVSLKDLIESGAHFGHQSKRWDPRMDEYLYDVKDGVHVFDLTKTKDMLEEALKELKAAAKENKKVLFLGTKKQVKDKIQDVADKTSSYFVNERWLGGTFTNFDQIRSSARKLTDMKDKMAKGEYDEYTKKERLEFQREIERLERFFGGIVGMEQLPDYIVIVDVKREFAAAREARMAGVKSIGIVDSNSDPTSVDYPVPMNDDATRALEYVLGLMQEVMSESIVTKKQKNKKSEKPANKKVTEKSKESTEKRKESQGGKGQKMEKKKDKAKAKKSDKKNTKKARKPSKTKATGKSAKSTKKQKDKKTKK